MQKEVAKEEAEKGGEDKVVALRLIWDATVLASISYLCFFFFYKSMVWTELLHWV